jgi:hypothetical protein
MTSRQGLWPYRGFPVGSSCPKSGKFNTRTDAVPQLLSTIAITITRTKNEHEGEAPLRPHDPKVRKNRMSQKEVFVGQKSGR